jgi:hypothetical protein
MSKTGPKRTPDASFGPQVLFFFFGFLNDFRFYLCLEGTKLGTGGDERNRPKRTPDVSFGPQVHVFFFFEFLLY